MAIVEIMGILNFDDDVQFWYTITVLLPVYNIFYKILRIVPNDWKIKFTRFHENPSRIDWVNTKFS